MNLAFSAVLILLIFTPGAILRRSYFSGPFSKKFISTSYIDEITYAVIPGALMHACAILALHAYTNYRIDFEILGMFLMGAKEDENIKMAFNTFGSNIHLIILYNVGLWLIALILGYSGRKIVRLLSLDKRFNWLKFDNEWYYLLRGEILAFPNVKGDIENVDFVWIDALVKTSEGPIIYSGILEEFFLSEKGGLDSIYLSNVSRRPLTDDPKPEQEKETEGDQRYYHIPGNFFFIPYSKMINLNVTYYELGDETALDSDVAKKEDANKPGQS